MKTPVKIWVVFSIATSVMTGVAFYGHDYPGVAAFIAFTFLGLREVVMESRKRK